MKKPTKRWFDALAQFEQLPITLESINMNTIKQSTSTSTKKKIQDSINGDVEGENSTAAALVPHRSDPATLDVVVVGR